MQSEYWQRQKTLLTEREVSFMKGLFRIVDMKRWYLCPQVRVADIVQLNGNTLGMDELIAKAWRFVRERFRSYQTELKSRGIKRARARRDANRERQDIVTLVKRQLTREISEGRFTANREAVKREVERRVKERMILSRNRNYSRLATASP